MRQSSEERRRADQSDAARGAARHPPRARRRGMPCASAKKRGGDGRPASPLPYRCKRSSGGEAVGPRALRASERRVSPALMSQDVRPRARRRRGWRPPAHGHRAARDPPAPRPPFRRRREVASRGGVAACAPGALERRRGPSPPAGARRRGRPAVVLATVHRDVPPHPARSLPGKGACRAELPAAADLEPDDDEDGHQPVVDKEAQLALERERAEPQPQFVAAPCGRSSTRRALGGGARSSPPRQACRMHPLRAGVVWRRGGEGVDPVDAPRRSHRRAGRGARRRPLPPGLRPTRPRRAVAVIPRLEWGGPVLEAPFAFDKGRRFLGRESGRFKAVALLRLPKRAAGRGRAARAW
jgi:hypothetical protein